MAERLDDRDLERTLSDIGTRLGGTKRDLWPAVRTRIAERRARPWWSRLSIERGALAPVAATLAVILVAALLLTPRVADALGVARGTVKSRLSRAIARLREITAGEVPADA